MSTLILPLSAGFPIARLARWLRRMLGGLVLVVAAYSAAPAAQEMNGFDLKNSLIPWLQINFGGPEKDGIPSIDKPELVKTAGEITDRIGDTVVTIRYDHKARRATAHGADGTQMAAVAGYWFAWYAFHPATEIFRAGTAPRQQG